MSKIIRVVEVESCSVLQAYYVAPSQNIGVEFSRCGADGIKSGFEDEKYVEEIAEAFRHIPGCKNIVEIFDFDEIDKHPLPKIGPIFA